MTILNHAKFSQYIQGDNGPLKYDNIKASSVNPFNAVLTFVVHCWDIYYKNQQGSMFLKCFLFSE